MFNQLNLSTPSLKGKEMETKKISDIKKVNSLSQTLVHKQKGTLVAPKEVLQKIETLAPAAVNTLEELMGSAKAESVRLKAALELLQLAGITKETKLTIKHDVQDLDEAEINDRLTQLLSKAQGVLIEGEAKDVTPK